MSVAAEASSGPPWLAIVLAVIALLSAVGVALAPAMVERLRRRGRDSEDPPAAEPARSADLALAMVEQALRDAWQQRDEAEERADQYLRERDQARAELARYQARDRGIDA